MRYKILNVEAVYPGSDPAQPALLFPHPGTKNSPRLNGDGERKR